MSYYRPSSSNQKRSTAASALREQVKNGGSFASSGPMAGSVSPIGGSKGRPSSAPTVNNNVGRGLQRGALVGASSNTNTNAISAYSFTNASNSNQRPQNRRTQSDQGSGSNRSNRPSSQQMQRSSFLPNNTTLNRSLDSQSKNSVTRYDKDTANTAVSRNPLRSSSDSGRSVNAPAPRARSSGHVRQQYLAHLGIDTSASPSLPNKQTSTSADSARPGSGGLSGRHRKMPEPLSADKKGGHRIIPGTNTLDKNTPPAMQPLTGGTPVWWKRAFTKGDDPKAGRTSEGGKRRIHFHDQVL